MTPEKSPPCMRCRHYHADAPTPKCAAFGRIPDAIWTGGDPHTEPYPGDGGIRFEPKTDDQDDDR